MIRLIPTEIGKLCVDVANGYQIFVQNWGRLLINGIEFDHAQGVVEVRKSPNFSHVYGDFEKTNPDEFAIFSRIAEATVRELLEREPDVRREAIIEHLELRKKKLDHDLQVERGKCEDIRRDLMQTLDELLNVRQGCPLDD